MPGREDNPKAKISLMHWCTADPDTGANCEPMPRARAPYHMWYPSSVGQGDECQQILSKEDQFKFKSVHICIFQIYQNIISLKSNLNASYILDHFMNDVTTDNLFWPTLNTYTWYFGSFAIRIKCQRLPKAIFTNRIWSKYYARNKCQSISLPETHLKNDKAFVLENWVTQHM